MHHATHFLHHVLHFLHHAAHFWHHAAHFWHHISHFWHRAALFWHHAVVADNDDIARASCRVYTSPFIVKAGLPRALIAKTLAVCDRTSNHDDVFIVHRLPFIVLQALTLRCLSPCRIHVSQPALLPLHTATLLLLQPALLPVNLPAFRHHLLQQGALLLQHLLTPLHCLVCLSGLSVWFVCLVCLSEWSVSGPSVCLVRPSVWSICLSGPSVCLSVLPFSASISLALQDLLCLLPAPKYLQLHGEHGVSRHLGMVSENSQAGLWATP